MDALLALALLVAFSLASACWGADSREHSPAPEERLARLGVTWRDLGR